MRQVVCAAVVLFLSAGFVQADELFGAIKKIDGNKITVAQRQKGSKESKEVTLTVASNVKVTKAKFNREAKKVEAGDVLADGLKSEIFQRVGAAQGRGVLAHIVTNDDNQVIQIDVFQFKGRPRNNKNNQ